MSTQKATNLRGAEARIEYGFPAKATFHLKRAQGLIPPPVMFGPRTAVYPAHEAEVINAARIAGKTEDEIRGLVITLVAARKNEGGRDE